MALERFGCRRKRGRGKGECDETLWHNPRKPALIRNDCHGRQRLSKLPLRVTLWSLVKLLVSYRREATLVKKADSCTHYGTFSCFPASLGESCGVSPPPFCDAL